MTKGIFGIFNREHLAHINLLFRETFMSSVSVPTTKVIMLATQVKKSKGLEKKHGGGLSI